MTAFGAFEQTVESGYGMRHAAPGLQAPALAKQSCSDVVYSNEAQASGPGGEPNAAGVRFTPRGDTFTIWDNQADGRRVTRP